MSPAHGQVPSSSVPPQLGVLSEVPGAGVPTHVTLAHEDLLVSSDPSQHFATHGQVPGSNASSQFMSVRGVCPQLPEDEPCTDLEDYVSRLISVGDFCVVLGDNLEGYYLVKCLSTTLDSFDGKYLKLSSEIIQDKVIFRETQACDTFFKRTIVSHIFVTRESAGRKSNFIVNKQDLDEILLTISELSHI